MENQEVLKTKKRFYETVGFHFATVGFLVLILMIPMTYVSSLISERKYRKKEVSVEIAKEWGSDTDFYGPVLKIPYKTYEKRIYYDNDGKKNTEKIYKNTDYIYILPETLNIEGKAITEIKNRAIYKFPVYRLQVKFKGNFKFPDFSKYNVSPQDIEYKNIHFVMLIDNMKGIAEKPKLKTNNNSLNLTTGELNLQSNHFYKSLVSEPIKIDMEQKNQLIDFKIDMSIKGSKSIKFIPVGKQTQINLTSNWKTPSFVGMFLPDNKEKLTDKGFDAHWKINNFQRSFGQVMPDRLRKIDENLFGVEFYQPVDEYQQNERTSKYGFLVIFLTFIVFFILQNIGKINIHLFQYFLIGLALVIFYTLLLSFSENLGFKTSYLIASTATITLITLYSRSIFNHKNFVQFVFGALVGLYGFIYVIIQLENYALLAGSIGLFIIVAMIMYFSRKIDWGK